MVKYNEYYPFGMNTANSWTRENVTGNNFLANGGTELNTTSNLYDLDFRNYDPALGRMYGVDPMASKYSSLTPYNYSFNNPIGFNDPTGADPPSNYFYNGAGAYGYPGYTYDDVVPPTARGDYNCAMCWRENQAGALANYGAIAGYGGSMNSWQSSTFDGVKLTRYGQMVADARAVQNGSMSVGEYAARYGTAFTGTIAYDRNANEAYKLYVSNGSVTGFDRLASINMMNLIASTNKFDGLIPQELLDVTSKFWTQLVETERFFRIKREEIEAKYSSEFDRTEMKMRLFLDQLDYGKPFDIKEQGKGFHWTEIGEISIFERKPYLWTDYGNINFGFAAKVLGLPLELAKFGAGMAQVLRGNAPPDYSNRKGYFDERRDTDMIVKGYNYVPFWRKK